MGKVSRAARGFSLIVVVMTIAILAILGSSVLLLSQSDYTTAMARERRSFALIAAHTGLTNDISRPQFNPNVIVDQRACVEAGNCTPTMPAWVDLPGIDSDGDGNVDLQPRYRIYGASTGANGYADVICDGQVLQAGTGRVAGAAMLASSIFIWSSDSPYGVQPGYSAYGGGQVGGEAAGGP